MEKVKVEITLGKGALLPAYGSEFAAGCDVHANLEGLGREELEKRIKGKSVITTGRGEGDKDKLAVLLRSGDRFLFPTGLAVAVPDGYELQVRPRSGLALKQGITVLNTPGTIDSDYRGEVGVILMNNSDKGVLIEDGERIAQLILTPVVHADFKVVKELNKTTRGTGGFGSTGTKATTLPPSQTKPKKE